MNKEEKVRSSTNVKESFISNLKMRNKLIFMSSISFLLTLIVSIVSIVQFAGVYKETNYMEENSMELLVDGLALLEDLNDLRTNLYIAIAFGSNGDVTKKNEGLRESEAALHDINDTMLEFYDRAKSMNLGGDIDRELGILIEKFSDYVELYDDLFDNIRVDRYETVLDMLDKNAQLVIETNILLNSIIDNTVNLIIASTKQMNDGVYFGIVVLSVLLVVIFILNLILIPVMTKPIDRSVQKVLSNIEYLKMGQFDKIESSNALDEFGQINRDITEVTEVIEEVIEDVLIANKSYEEGSLNISIDGSKYNGGYEELAKVVNSIFVSVFEKLNRLIVALNELGEGNLDVDYFEFPGEQKTISDGLFACVNSINGVSEEIKVIASNANVGILEQVDTSNYHNGWREILDELNKLVINIGEPINEVNNVINDMSNGQLSTKITGDYKGIFNDLKTNVNTSVDSVNNAIIETKESLNKISHNDINFKLENNARGDFAEIQIAINSIILRLNEVFDEFQSSSNDVLEVANQLSSSSQKIANGATEQASTIEELNATVEIINANTSENAKKAVGASEIANKSRENAVRGDEEMKTMLESMEEIKIASDNIANIIKVIDDIAFQTNLLALNASVEAARAGQHGKGFAVVAEEVRTLAGRSKEAANQTTELINESLQKVSLGNDLANSTAKALHQIVTNIAEVSEVLEDISQSSSEQANSISEILTNLSTFEIVVQNNTNEAEESAESSRHLSEQSSILKSLIDEFKLLNR